MSLSILKTRLAFQMTSFIMILNLLHLLGRLLVWEFIAGFKLFMFCFDFCLFVCFFKAFRICQWNRCQIYRARHTLCIRSEVLITLMHYSSSEGLGLLCEEGYNLKGGRKEAWDILECSLRSMLKWNHPFCVLLGIYQQHCSNGDVTGGEAPSPWALEEVPWWR